MTGASRSAPTLDLPRIIGRIRPRPRWTETRLLLLVAVALLVGSISLGASLGGRLMVWAPGALAIYLLALGLAHLAQVMAGRRSDEVLLPVVGLLGGISLLLMQRLPQDLVTMEVWGRTLGLGEVQLLWLVMAIAIATTLGIVVRSDSWLRQYKYTWATAGIALLLLTFVLGTDVAGQRLTLTIGPFSGQPSELLKVILVVFLAGYLSENRPLLIEQDTRIGPLRLPPLPYLAPMVAMWAIALGIVVVQRDLGAALLFFAVFLALVYAATGRISLVIIGTILFFVGSALMANLFPHVRDRVDIWLDPFADPLGAGYQVVQSLHAFARGGLVGTGLGEGLPMVGGRLPIPEVHTDFPLAALGEELGLVGVDRDPRPVLRPDRTRAADRCVRCGRFPGDPRGRPRAGRRRAGIHHRGGQPQGPAAHRRDAAVHQLRRLVAAGERDRRRPAAGAVGPRRRAATAADRRPALARPPPAGESLMLATSTRRRPLGRTIVHVAIVLALAFGLLAGAGGYWAVVRSTDLARSPYDPAVIAAARTVPRGRIIDREGHVLVRNKKDANGEFYRSYSGEAISHVLGYASTRYGKAGLELAYDAELSGLAGDPVADVLRKFGTRPYDPKDLQMALSWDMQRAAVTALGERRGAVVMLDPRNGEVIALASTPTYDASAIADPTTADATFKALRADETQPLLPRATLGRYVPGSVFKIVTAIAGLGSGAVTPATTYEQQPPAEEDGLVVEGFRIRDGHHPQTGDRALDLVEATEASCNIWYALTGLETGGEDLVGFAGRLGFGAPIPFDLPTATSQVTDGSGSAPGGFVDDVELANAAYGQAETFVTPLQMAQVAATVANGGELMAPRIVTAINGRDSSRGIGERRLARVIDADDAAAIKEAMVQAVEGRARPRVHDRREDPGRDDRRQVRHGRARRPRRTPFVVRRVRARRGTDRRDRRHRRAGRSRGRGRVTDRRAPDVDVARGRAVTDAGGPSSDGPRAVAAAHRADRTRRHRGRARAAVRGRRGRRMGRRRGVPRGDGRDRLPHDRVGRWADAVPRLSGAESSTDSAIPDAIQAS